MATCGEESAGIHPGWRAVAPLVFLHGRQELCRPPEHRGPDPIASMVQFPDHSPRLVPQPLLPPSSRRRHHSASKHPASTLRTICTFCTTCARTPGRARDCGAWFAQQRGETECAIRHGAAKDRVERPSLVRASAPSTWRLHHACAPCAASGTADRATRTRRRFHTREKGKAHSGADSRSSHCVTTT